MIRLDFVMNSLGFVVDGWGNYRVKMGEFL